MSRMDKDSNFLFNTQESLSQLSQRVDYLSNEIKSNRENNITNKISKENFFHGNEYVNRALAVKYIKEFYGHGKKLKENMNVTRGCFKIDLMCSFPACQFRVVCRKGRKSCFSFDEQLSNLNHGVYDVINGCLVGLCTDYNRHDRLSTVLLDEYCIQITSLILTILYVN